jgi:hypothetical protein
MTQEHSAHFRGIKFPCQMMGTFPEGHNANSAAKATMRGAAAATATIMQRAHSRLRIDIPTLECGPFGETYKYNRSILKYLEK